MKHEATVAYPVLPQDVRQRLLEFQDEALNLNRHLSLYSAASVADFWSNHILHSLAIASRQFPRGSLVVDWGTGGGLPGLPLAILFPESRFVLVDSIEKKVRAVRTMARRLGLLNVEAWAGRAEEFDQPFHYAVSRATAPLSDLWRWSSPHFQRIETGPADWRQGLIVLKGGDLSAELAAIHPDVAARLSRFQIAESESAKQLVHLEWPSS